LRTLLIFILSAISSSTILYVLGIVWFGERRNKLVRSYFIMGVITAYWIVFSGILTVANERSFAAILSMGMVFVCSLPFALLWFSLRYTKSKAVRSKPLLALVIAIPTANILLMLTSGMHRAYFTDYSFPTPGKGVFFWVNLALCVAAVLTASIRIIIHALKTRHNMISTLCAGIGILVSTALHLSYALGSLMRYDLSSIGFIVTFLIFTFSAHRSRIFRLRRITMDQIFSSLDDMFFIFDEEGVLIECNPTARGVFPQLKLVDGTTHYSELMGQISADLHKSTPEYLIEHITGECSNCKGEIHVNTFDGHLNTYILNWHVIVRKTVICGYRLSLSDISTHRAMIEEISEKNRILVDLNNEAVSASKAKSAFLANMSHEIRTPLNAIIGMAQIVKKSIDNREKAVSSLEQILNASNHLLNLLNNVLDMSKIESGKFMLASEPFSIKTALDEVISVFTQRCEEKNLALIVNMGEFPSEVIGDALRLKQVIINLMGNSVKFTDYGGCIRLIAKGEKLGDKMRLDITVSDTGIGMSQEQLSRLFTAFEQSDSSIAARYGGTGIGLALSQHLIGMMGSTITVESQVGKGSDFTFSVELPLKAEQSTEAAKDSSPDTADNSPGTIDLSGKRILIVDDIEINRIILSEFLSGTNAIIEEASDGAQAVRMCLDAPGQNPVYYYDLILMDIQMPNMDGYEATRQIKAIPRDDTASLPIVAMTANAYQEDVEKALAAGMSAHLAKPVDINKFYILLSQLLAADNAAA